MTSIALLKPDFTPVKFGFWYDNGRYVVVGISLCVGIILFVVGYCVWCKRRCKHRGTDHLGQTDETGDFVVVTAFNDPSAPILSKDFSRETGSMVDKDTGTNPVAGPCPQEVQIEMVPLQFPSPYDPTRALLRAAKKTEMNNFSFLKEKGGGGGGRV